MVKIINEDLRSTLKSFTGAMANSIRGNTDVAREFFELYESIIENNEKLKEICNKKEFKDNKYFKDIYPIAKRLYDDSNRYLKQIENLVSKVEKEIDNNSLGGEE